MPASFACRDRAAYRSRVTRLRKQSSGIQFAPLTKTGSPFTTKPNDVPSSSASVRNSTVRNPVRPSQRSRFSPSTTETS